MRRLLSIIGTAVALSAPYVSLAADPASVIEAVKAGDLPAVRNSLEQVRNPNQTQPDGTTPLHWAVQEARLDIVEALLAAGANVNAKNRYGVTPLVLAAATGNAPITQALLKAGADFKMVAPETGSVLSTAARTGNPEVINVLLAAGANANFAESSSGQTPLMRAAAEGHPDAVKALIAGGAKVGTTAKDQQTALFYSVRRGDIASVGILLAAGADVNTRTAPETEGNGRGNGGNQKRAGYQAKFSPFGDSMLVVAIMNNNFDIADLLLNKGADPNASGPHWSPLHSVVRVRNYEEDQFPAPKGTGTLDSLEFAKHLLAHGANPSARAETHTTRRAGGDQNYDEWMGATPFFLAAKAGDLPMIRLLLANKADYTTPTYLHTTPLMVAAGVGCVTGQWIEPESDILATVKILVDELKADVNAVNDRNETALHGAAMRAMDSVVQYLADKGAKLDVRNSDNMRALDIVVDGIAKPVTIGGVPIEKIGYSDHTAALLRKLMAEKGYSIQASLQ
jgi:ankyrin repeat protein